MMRRARLPGTRVKRPVTAALDDLEPLLIAENDHVLPELLY
jgi:hypothetical protein